ncbi:MAG: GNAT family N-acetyltransferase [Cyanobacteria bacterium SZAS LIN-2]|nr:GNAT family N-acetyltransferase [Cyanobacteria bacterium SZAS LIN-3]MBS1995798.1 GNAT family N-acetyltransferase [Cyanobacteria bacterium SZAS LIN-2]MBS2006752.1 GNAT family N-acetyltransferase [Cyanobacteria bacterium SZAS TMP-1]
MDLLETERLILRDLRLTDCDDIVRFANDSALNYNLSFGDLKREDGARKYIKKSLAEGDRRLSYKLAILLKPDRELIGSCWLDITSEAHQRGSIGYFIAQSHWGRGYATEAARALITFGLEKMQLQRIEATCDADHAATRKVLEKAGMKREARMRQKRRREAVWTDSCLYAVIAPRVSNMTE